MTPLWQAKIASMRLSWISGNKLCRLVHLLSEEFNVFLNATELILDGDTLLLDETLQRLYLFLRQSQHDLSLEGDSIAHVAAMPGSKACICLCYSLAHETYHLLVGIGAALVDLQS